MSMRAVITTQNRAGLSALDIAATSCLPTCSTPSAIEYRLKPIVATPPPNILMLVMSKIFSAFHTPWKAALSGYVFRKEFKIARLVDAGL